MTKAGYCKTLTNFVKWAILGIRGNEYNWQLSAVPVLSVPGQTSNYFKYTAICGNKMPARCNRGFYCRSYCLLNIFRASLCPSSGAQEYYTVVAACGISCCGFQVAGLVWSWGLCVRFAGCCSILQTEHITLSSTLDQQLKNHSTKYHRQQHCIILLSSWWWA